MALEIKDVINEGTKPGVVEAIGLLSVEQTTGILASVAKYINQASDIVGGKGIGTYGLTQIKLEEAGVLKKGIGLSSDISSLPAILLDPSVYSGKYDILMLSDITGNEQLQRTILSSAVGVTIAKLTRLGIITNDTTLADYAVYVSAAAAHTANEIHLWVNGAESAILDTIANQARYALALVDTKAASLLAKVQGIGGGVVSKPVKSTSTVKTADVDAEVDKLIGSARIGSTVDPGEATATVSKAAGYLSIEDFF